MFAHVNGPEGEGKLKIRLLEIGEVVDAPHRMVVNGKDHTFETRITTFWTTEEKPEGEILGVSRGWTHVRGPWEDIKFNPDCKGKVIIKGPVPGIENLGYALGKCDSCEYETAEELYRVA